MAIRAAMQYYDDSTQSIGFMLGSDNLTDYKAIGKLPLFAFPFGIDSSFEKGKTAGIICGAGKGNLFQVVGFFKGALSLDKLFEDIHDGRDYSSFPVMSDLDAYTMMVARNSGISLDLYTVSNMRDEEKNVANLLVSIPHANYFSGTDTLLFYSPNLLEIDTLNIPKRIDFEEARTIMENLLTASAAIPEDIDGSMYIYPKPHTMQMNFFKSDKPGDYKPGKANMVYVNSQVTGRV